MKDNYDDLFGTMFDFDGDGHSDITETYMAYRMMTDDEMITLTHIIQNRLYNIVQLEVVEKSILL